MNIIQYIGRGVYHEDNKLPCQDRAKYSYAKNGNIIMALSDGCSSASLAEDAAEINVNAVIDFFSNVTASDFIKKSDPATEVINHIKSTFRKKHPKVFDDSPEELSATLLFAVHDSKNTVIGHIGDGNILCTSKKGETILFSEEDNNGSSDRTFFTVLPDAVKHLHIFSVSSSDTGNIVMYSDGPQKMLWYRGDKNTELAAKGIIDLVKNNKISDCKSLAVALEEMTSNAMYQLMDDWSMLIFDSEQKQCDDIFFTPVSMKKRFLKNFSRDNVNENEVL